MYDWVTHVHSHLAGECPHKCSYCYVQKIRRTGEKYKGNLRLIESELDVNYGSGKVIFIEHMNDLFAYHEGIKDISQEWIIDILTHCRKYPGNKYVFQTKNPCRVHLFYKQLPHNCMIGTTIETNFDEYWISAAPNPFVRYLAIKKLREEGYPVFVTIEPIVDFDVDVLSEWIIDIKPEFINIGADSKGCKLPEPTPGKILKFIDILKENGINIKKKTNLERILK
ncbi:MAG: hypothetical protein M1365_12550 [Actinobacteria bacterium]|nr:hypothetical protein [Actinomycetota bacterium]